MHYSIKLIFRTAVQIYKYQNIFLEVFVRKIDRVIYKIFSLLL